ncbi:MAG TPA: cyclopropane-fatty-acyl-phospholipid synthase family protein [Gammaproteobacteria bacterium]|nr:cyclopropane-fatty-acyl-phospholipid synthase family protein [Gammaproteobacteria bacterium]
MATKDDVQFHYDADTDFFKCFLDNRYGIYSCGVWENATTLEDAQEAKLKRLADFANVKKGDMVLDIGCGWGGMLDYCIHVRKAKKVTGITLSQTQYDYIAQKKMPLIDVQLCSWSEFRVSKRFDAVVSIGAMEHFASFEDRKQGNQINVYRDFFKCCFDVSTDGAYLGLQTIITVKNPDTLQSMKDTHYLLKHVFPGSVLPEIDDLGAAIHKLYEPVRIKKIGRDYARTLQEWKKRLLQNEALILKKYGEELFTHYNHYFDAAIRSFQNGYTSLLQMSLKKIA